MHTHTHTHIYIHMRTYMYTKNYLKQWDLTERKTTKIKKKKNKLKGPFDRFFQQELTIELH